MTDRLLPESDQELLAMWELCGRNNKATGAIYGTSESPVRKRLLRINGPTGRPYARLPKPVGELYEEWLATGTGLGSQKALADSYGVQPQTLRRAFRLYRERNTEEDERREREEDPKDPGRGAGLPGRAGVRHSRNTKLRVPQHAHGSQVR